MEIPLETLYQCQRGIIEGDGANRNFGMWLSYSRGILGTFGWHHIYRKDILFIILSKHSILFMETK
jgi:hypothetical protein